MTLLPITIASCHRPDRFREACTAHGLTFERYGPAAEPKCTPAARVNPALALLDTPYTANWLRHYYNRQAAGVARVGMMHVPGALLTDDWGLVLTQPDENTGSFAVTSMSGFGWTPEQFSYMAEQGHLSAMPDGALALETGNRTRIKLAGTSALLSFPGAYTYGHWITDICARLELLTAQHDINAIDHFFLPGVSAWMFPFLAAYGVRQDRIIQLDKTHIYELEQLLVPTTMGQHHRDALPVQFARTVFHRLSSISSTWGRLPVWGKARKRSPLAFVLHTALTSAPGREIGNIAEIVALVEELGGQVLDPLKLPLPAFLNRIRESDLVIGQDSSALHNLAMAPRDLLVIQTEPRFNMLHPSIQEATGQRVGFMMAQADDAGVWTVRPRRLRTLIRWAREARLDTENPATPVRETEPQA